MGPNPNSADAVSQTRRKLRDALRARGHLAEFSEDLIEAASPHSILAQQLAQARAFDVIFSIPGSFGAVAEIHDFARIPGVSHKLIGWVDNAHVHGYSAQTLLSLQTSASCKIELYDEMDLPDCVVDYAISEVVRLQEIFYMSGRR